MVSVIGDINLDIIIFFTKLPNFDEEIEIKKLITSGGGVGANISYTLAKLGTDVNLIGCVGKDIIGEFLLKELNEVGVNTKEIQILPNERTGICIALVEKGKDRKLLTFRGANKILKPKQISSVNSNKNNWIHISGYGPEFIENVHKNSSTKVIISYDPGSMVLNNLNYHLLEKNLKKIDFIFLNLVEFEALKEKFDSKFEMKVKNLIVKKGRYGVDYYQNGFLKYSLKAFEVSVLDTTGAGDVFDASFIHAFNTENLGIKESLIFSLAAAALSIRSFGVREGVPNKKEIIDFINYQEGKGR
jgi:ribokinase